jgi:hypothetical protein
MDLRVDLTRLVGLIVPRLVSEAAVSEPVAVDGPALPRPRGDAAGFRGREPARAVRAVALDAVSGVRAGGRSGGGDPAAAGGAGGGLADAAGCGGAYDHRGGAGDHARRSRAENDGRGVGGRDRTAVRRPVAGRRGTIGSGSGGCRRRARLDADAGKARSKTEPIRSRPWPRRSVTLSTEGGVRRVHRGSGGPSPLPTKGMPSIGHSSVPTLARVMARTASRVPSGSSIQRR